MSHFYYTEMNLNLFTILSMCVRVKNSVFILTLLEIGIREVNIIILLGDVRIDLIIYTYSSLVLFPSLMKCRDNAVRAPLCDCVYIYTFNFVSKCDATPMFKI